MNQSAPDDAAARDEWCSRALAQPGESRFVEANGARLHYLAWGDERAGKPVLMLVHGFRGHAHWWDAVAPLLATQYRVVALDLSGMGDSEHRSAYPLGTFAGDVIGVAEHVCPDGMTLVAHSFGGSRSLQACVTRPDLFRRAVIVDSYFRFRGEPQATESVVRGTRIYPDLDAGMGRFRLLPNQPVWIPALFEHVARHSLKSVPDGWSWKFDPKLPAVIGLDREDEETLAAVRIPVTYVYGQHSAVVSVERANGIVARLAHGAGPIVIPAAHHHMMLDRPLALVSVLRGILGSST